MTRAGFHSLDIFQSTLPVRGATIVGGYGDLYLWVFQSTLPVGGATTSILTSSVATKNFNPRSPCGERPHYSRLPSKNFPISIHAPRAGSDAVPCLP